MNKEFNKKKKKNKKKHKNGIIRVDITNIDKNIDEKALKELFNDFNCENLKLFKNQNGFSHGYMNFNNEEDANNCIQVCNKINLGNKQIHFEKWSFDI